MAKGDQDAVNSAINTESSRMNNQRNDFGGALTNQYNTAYNQDQQLYGDTVNQFKQASAGYAGLADPNKTYGLSQDEINALYGSMGAGGVGYNAVDTSGLMGGEAYKGYQNLSGGMNDGSKDAINIDLGGIESAMAGYGGFAKTGGFSDADLQMMRTRAESPTTSIYSTANDELSRQRAIQGGYGGNYGAVSAKMARDMSNQIDQADINSEANIAQLVQQGKLSGLQGQASSGQAAASARTQVEQVDAQMRAAGLAGMTDLQKAKMQADLQNAQGQLSAGSANASLANSRAGLMVNMLNSNKLYGSNMQLSANAGLTNVGNSMTNLYGTTPGQSALYLNNLQGNMNQQQGGNLGLINSQIGASQIPSTFQNVMGYGKDIGSMVGSGMSAYQGATGGGQGTGYDGGSATGGGTSPMGGIGGTAGSGSSGGVGTGVGTGGSAAGGIGAGTTAGSNNPGLTWGSQAPSNIGQNAPASSSGHVEPAYAPGSMFSSPEWLQLLAEQNRNEGMYGGFSAGNTGTTGGLNLGWGSTDPTNTAPQNPGIYGDSNIGMYDPYNTEGLSRGNY